MDLAATVLGALLVASGAYCTAALAATARWRPTSPAPSNLRRPAGVSLLKPAVGAGKGFADLLRSHAAQDHPDFEILVGAGPGDTHARDAVRSVQADYPELRIELIDCPDPTPGCNGKVQVLERLSERAAKPVWVVTDADIRVPPRHLRTVCAELQAEGTGLVTCLYGAEAGRGLASRLEAIRVSAEFPAQVLLAEWVQGMRFALGATLAFRRETIESLGGFRSLRRLIGDDYVLGERVAATGLAVRISSLTVSTRLAGKGGWREAWQRQVRWSRTIRYQRPTGHAGLAVTFAVPWCMAAISLQPDTLWPFAALAGTVRVVSGAVSISRCGRRRKALDLVLLPLADLFASVAWLWSHFGNTVTWGERGLRIGKGGRLIEGARNSSNGL